MDKVMLFRDLLFEKTGFLAVSIIFSTAGIIPTVSGSYERLYSFFGNGMVYRRSLGFSNYNILGLVVFELIVLYILYVWQKQGRSLLGGAVQRSIRHSFLCICCQRLKDSILM